MQSTDSLADVRIAPLEFVYVARGDLLICNSIVDLPAWECPEAVLELDFAAFCLVI